MNPWYQLAMARAAILISILLSGCVTIEEQCGQRYDDETRAYYACVDRGYQAQSKAFRELGQALATPAPSNTRTTCQASAYGMDCLTTRD